MPAYKLSFSSYKSFFYLLCKSVTRGCTQKLMIKSACNAFDSQCVDELKSHHYKYDSFDIFLFRSCILVSLNINEYSEQGPHALLIIKFWVYRNILSCCLSHFILSFIVEHHMLCNVCGLGSPSFLYISIILCCTDRSWNKCLCKAWKSD